MVVDVINALENLCDEMNSTFHCTHCKQAFDKKQFYEQHLANEHGEGDVKEKKTGKFDCNYCDSSFRRERNLTLHIRDDHEKEENDEDDDDEDDEEEDGDTNDETVGFDVDIESDPNLLTYKADDPNVDIDETGETPTSVSLEESNEIAPKKSDEHLASEKVTEAVSNSNEEVSTNYEHVANPPSLEMSEEAISDFKDTATEYDLENDHKTIEVEQLIIVKEASSEESNSLTEDLNAGVPSDESYSIEQLSNEESLAVNEVSSEESISVKEPFNEESISNQESLSSKEVSNQESTSTMDVTNEESNSLEDQIDVESNCPEDMTNEESNPLEDETSEVSNSLEDVTNEGSYSLEKMPNDEAFSIRDIILNNGEDVEKLKVGENISELEKDMAQDQDVNHEDSDHTMQLDESSCNETTSSINRDSVEGRTLGTGEKSSQAHYDVLEGGESSGKPEQVEESLLECEKDKSDDVITKENTELDLNENQSNEGDITLKELRKDTQSNMEKGIDLESNLELGIGLDESDTENKDANDEGNKMSDEFLINGESIVMDDIAFNILANTLEMTMDTQEEELNFSKESSDVDESTISSKRKTDDDSDIINPAEKKIKEEPLDDNILGNSLEMTMETGEKEFQLPPEPTAVVDPVGKKIKEEPQDEIELSGQPVFSSTPAPLSVLKAELKKKEEIKKEDSKVNRKPRAKEYKPRAKEYNYPNVAKKLICSYCKQIFPSRPDFNDHMAADHPDILSKHSNSNANNQTKVATNSNTNKAKTSMDIKKGNEMKSISRSVKITHIPGPTKAKVPGPVKSEVVIKTEKDVKEEEIIMNSIPKSTRIIFTPVSADGSPLSQPVSTEKPKITTTKNINVGKGVRITQIGANDSKAFVGKGVKITQLGSKESTELKVPKTKSIKITPTSSIKDSPAQESSKKDSVQESSKKIPVQESSKKNPVQESSKKNLVQETSKKNPVQESAKTNPVKDSPKAKLSKDSPKANPVKKLLCTYCKRVFLSRPEFNKHILEDHPDISNANAKETSKALKPAFKCNPCQTSFEDKQKYEQHMDAKHGHKCEHCNVSFRVKSKLEEHKRSAHSFKCTICNQKFVSNEKLSEHMETHNIKCEQCPEVFKSKMKLLEHKKAQHSHKCEKCNARFDEKSKLDAHMEKHRFRCDKCTEIFDTKVKVIEHKKASHTFICEKCKRTFDEKALLEDHMKTSHIHKCQACGSIYDFKNKLEDHMKKEHNFKCTHCEETFELEERVGEHEKEKHCSCETCEDEFVWAEPDHSCYYTKNNVRPTKERVQVQNLYFDYPASFI